LDLDVVWKGPYLFKAGLVLGLSSTSIRLRNGEGVISGVDKGKSDIVDCGIPLKGSELVLVALAISIDKLEIVAFCCLKSNFVEFHFNFSL